MRRRISLLASVAMLATALPIAATGAAAQEADTDPPVWINEFHYDNAGTDEGEFVEVALREGTGLAGWELVLYNGDNSTLYGTATALGDLDPEAATDGHAFVTVDYPVNGIQNGAPDGLALVDNGTVVQFLSYEGTFQATEGPAAGMTSTDIGASQTSSTSPGASLQLTGTGASYQDFTWESLDTSTAGSVNTGQVFGEPTDPEPEPAPTCDVADDRTVISEVQGAGQTSPLADETVTVEAVVTLVAPGIDGLFVQEEADDHDEDPSTSEGVFVYTAGNLLDELAEGETVQVTGSVSEYFGKTQLTSRTDVVVCADVEPVGIEPVELPLPLAPEDREPYESMLVTASDLVVSGNYSAYTHGELITGYQGVLYQSTELAPPGAPAQDVEAANQAQQLILDDHSSERVYGRSIWDQDPERRLGDEIPEVTGVLGYNFGDYKLQYTEFPEFELYGAPDVPQLEGGNDIGAFNVLNYFNEFGSSDRLRGARNEEQFELQSDKIVTTILDLDASVLGLIEPQNDYLDEYDDDPTTEPSVATLVDRLNDAAGEERYDYVRMPEDQLATEGLNGGGVGTDAIANGIIYQPDEVTQVGTAVTFDIDALLEGENPEDAENNRWPFAASFDIDGEVVTVVVNHFKSKGSSCDDVSGPDFAFGEDDGSTQAGNCDLTRRYAAERLIEWVKTDPTGVDGDDTMLVGDFNSYREEGPIHILEEAGYLDLAAAHDPGAFTYKFSGRVGTLDYLFASPSLAPEVTDAEIWQINSRASQADLYYLDPLHPEGPKGSSDHDPVVAALAPAVTEPEPTTPTSKDECKRGGWRSFTDPEFRNQGKCVSWVATGGRRP